MKLKFIPLLVAAMLLSVIISCKKNAKTQPAASNAPLKGDNGSLIYTGSATPSTTLGTTGDYYINLSSATLYGPKTATSWGIGVTMSLAANPPGVGQTLSGSGAPSATLGNVGDVYLDTSSYLLYGPKTASGWGSPISVAAPGSRGIYYSAWTFATNFRDTVLDNSSEHLADIAAPALTQNYLNSAAILVYFTFGSGSFPLPYISNAGGKSSTISFLPRVGHLIITRYTLDNTDSINLSTGLEYRYVIIPAGQLVAAAQHHVNLDDPNAVKAYFHLAD